MDNTKPSKKAAPKTLRLSPRRIKALLYLVKSAQEQIHCNTGLQRHATHILLSQIEDDLTNAK